MTGVKTLTMYLRAAKTELEAAGESSDGCAESVSKLRSELKSLTGVDIMLDDRTFKSTYQIVQEISKVWDSLSDVTQANVTSLIAGKRNANLVQALMQNFQDAERVMDVAAGAEGSALRENEKFLDSIEGHITRLNVAFEAFSQNMLSKDLFKGVIDAGTGLLNILGWLTDKLGAIPMAVVGVTTAMSLMGKAAKLISIEFSEAGTQVMLFGKKITALSMKNIGATLKSFGASALSTVLSSVASIGIGFAISGVVSWVTDLVNSAKAKIEQQREALQKAKDDAVEHNGVITEAVHKYIDLANQLERNEISNDEFNSSAKEVLETLLEQGENVDELIEKYGNLQTAMSAIAYSKLVQNYGGLKGNLRDKENALLGLVDFDNATSNPTALNANLGRWTYTLEAEERGKEFVEAFNKAMASEEITVSQTLSKALLGAIDDIDYTMDFGLSKLRREYALGGDGVTSAQYVDVWQTEKSLNTVLNLYDKCVAALEWMTEHGYQDVPLFDVLNARVAGMKDVVEEYNEALSQINENVLARAEATVANTVGFATPTNEKELEAYKAAMIAAVAETNQFEGSTEAVETAIANAVDEFINGKGWADRFTDSLKLVSDSAKTTTQNIGGVSDALKELKNADSVLEKARSEMNSGTGLSSDTLSAISKAIGDGRNISDFVYAENGMLKLNEEAWNAWRESITATQVQALIDQEDALGRLEDQAGGFTNAVLAKIGKIKPDIVSEAINQQIDEVFDQANVKLRERTRITGADMWEAGWKEDFEEAGEELVTLYSHTMSAVAGGIGDRIDAPEFKQGVVINLTPISPDGTKILSDKELEDYVKNTLLEGATSKEDIIAHDNLNLVMDVQVATDEKKIGQVEKEMAAAARAAHVVSYIVEAMKDAEAAGKTFKLGDWLSDQMDEARDSGEDMTDTLRDVFDAVVVLANGLDATGHSGLLMYINQQLDEMGLTLDDVVASGNVDAMRASLEALIEVLQTASNGNATDLTDLFSGLSTIEKKASTLQTALKALDTDGLQDWKKLVESYPELLDVEGLFDINTVEGQRAALEALLQVYADQYDELIEKRIGALETMRDEAEAANEDTAQFDRLIENLEQYRDLGMGDTDTSDPLGLNDFGKNIQAATKYAGDLQSALETVRQGEALTADKVAGLVNSHPEILSFGNLLGTEDAMEQARIIIAALNSIETGFGEFVDQQIANLDKMAETADDDTKQQIEHMKAYFLGLKEQFGKIYGMDGTDANDPFGMSKVYAGMKQAIDGASSLFSAMEKVKSGEMLAFKDALDLYTTYGDRIDIAELMNADTAAEQMAVLSGAVKVFSIEYDTKLWDIIGTLTVLQNNCEVGSDAWNGYGEAIATVHAHLGQFENDANKTTGSLYSLDKAMSFINSGTSFMKNIGPGTDILSQISEAKKLAESYSELTGETLEWKYLIKSIDKQTGEIHWDTDAIDGFTDAIIRNMVAEEGLERLYPGITEVLLKYADAAKEAADNTLSLGDAFSGIKAVRSFMENVKGGNTDTLSMIEDAQALAERLNELNGNDPNKKVDWTYFLSDKDVSNGLKNGFTWSKKALKGLSDAYVDAAIAAGYFGDEGEKNAEDLKAEAFAALETTNGIETLTDAMNKTKSAYELMNRIHSGSGSVISMLSELLGLAKDSDKIDLASLMTFDGDNLTLDRNGAMDALKDYIVDLFSNEALKQIPGLSDETLAALRSVIAAEVEAEEQTNRLAETFSAVSTAKSFLSDIRTQSDDLLGMIQTAMTMADASGQALSNFLSFGTNGEAVWNENAVMRYMGSYIANLTQIGDLSDDAVRSIKSVIYQQVREAGVAEEINDVLSKTREALSYSGNAYNAQQITYDKLQSLLAINKDYASAIEYNNGVMTLNREKYEEITDAVIDNYRAQAQAGKEAILNGDRYKELAKKVAEGIKPLEGEDLTDWLNMQAMITGFDMLANEIDNATAAYQRFLNADSSESGTQYGALVKAAEILNSVMNDKESKIYGQWSNPAFIEAMKFLTGGELQKGTEAYEEALKKIQRYSKEYGEGVNEFYQDLKSAGIIGADNAINASVDEIAKRLGVTTDVVRAMFEQLNRYQTQDNQIKIVGLEDVSTDAKTAQTGLEKMTGEVEAAKQAVDDLNNASVAPDTETGKQGLQELEDKAVALGRQLDGLNGRPIDFDVNKASIHLSSVSARLADLIRKLDEIARKGIININVTTTYRNVYDTTRYTIGGTTQTGVAAANGDEHARGGKTLVGELGREIVVDPKTGRWYTVGERGAEFVNLPNNAIVFNAEQTQKLLGSGKINSRAGRAMAGGSAAAAGRKADTETTTSTTAKTYWYAVVVLNGKTYGYRAFTSLNALINFMKKNQKLQYFEQYGGTDAKKKAQKRAKERAEEANRLLKQQQQQQQQQKVQQPTISGTDVATGTVEMPTWSTGSTGTKKSGKSSGSSGSKSKKSTGSTQKVDPLDEILETYKKNDEYYDHEIKHKEYDYDVGDRKLSFEKMEKALSEEIGIYEKRIKNAQKGIEEMQKKGAKDTDKQLQELEEYMWESKRKIWETLDKINSMYMDALNTKIDDFQTAYDKLNDVVTEFNGNGHISVDTFQDLIKNGVQFLDYLDIVNGKYVVNKEAVEAMVKAEKEQLAIETAMGYLQRIQEAVANDQLSRVKEYANETQKIGDNAWDAVEALLAKLKTSGIAEEYYVKIKSNIEKLRTLAGDVVMEIDSEISESRKKQASALGKIIDLTEDMIKQENSDHIKAIQKEVDLFREIVDLKKEALNKTKEEDSYQKNVNDKLKEVTDLQARIDRLSLDSSRSAKAERAKLMEELRAAQEDLQELQADHSYDAQTEALDKMAEAYEEERQGEIDVLEKALSSAEKLYQAAIARISNHWDTLYEDLLAWNTESGSSLNSEITENWNLALAAAHQYGDYVTAMYRTLQQMDANGEMDETLKHRVEDLTQWEKLKQADATSAATQSTSTGVQTPASITTTLTHDDDTSTGTTDIGTPIEEVTAPEETTAEKKKYVKVIGGSWWLYSGGPKKTKTGTTVKTGEKYEYLGEDKASNGDKYVKIKYNGKNRWFNSSGAKKIGFSRGGYIADLQTLAMANGDDMVTVNTLKKGEAVLTEPQAVMFGKLVERLPELSKAVDEKYELVDFKKVLSEKLGTAIEGLATGVHSVASTLHDIVRPATAANSSQSMVFSPQINVQIDGSSVANAADARRNGEILANTALDRLYTAFEKMGMNGISTGILKA